MNIAARGVVNLFAIGASEAAHVVGDAGARVVLGEAISEDNHLLEDAASAGRRIVRNRLGVSLSLLSQGPGGPDLAGDLVRASKGSTLLQGNAMLGVEDVQRSFADSADSTLRPAGLMEDVPLAGINNLRQRAELSSGSGHGDGGGTGRGLARAGVDSREEASSCNGSSNFLE